MNTVHGSSLPAGVSAFEKVSAGWIAFSRNQRPGMWIRFAGSLGQLPGGRGLAAAWTSLRTAANTCRSYQEVNDGWRRAFASVLLDRCPALGRSDSEVLVRSVVGTMDAVNASTLLEILQRAARENLRCAAADAAATAVTRLPGFNALDEDNQSALCGLLRQQVSELLERDQTGMACEDAVDASRRAAADALGTLDLEAHNLLVGALPEERSSIAARAFANLRTWAAVQVFDSASQHPRLGEAWCAFVQREAEFVADRRRRPALAWQKAVPGQTAAAASARLGRHRKGYEAHAWATAQASHPQDRASNVDRREPCEHAARASERGERP